MRHSPWIINQMALNIGGNRGHWDTDGRPRSYTAERAKRICDLVAEGESLRTIGEMRGMPARRTVRGWLNAHPEFEREYEVARRERTDNLVDESIEIADSVSGCTDPTAVQAAR